MQKISNDINTQIDSQSHSPATDAIKAHNENLINIINFSRRNLSNVIIIKKDGTKEKYNIEKVVEAIKKSATRMLVEFSEKEIKDICAFVNKSVLDMNKDEVRKFFKESRERIKEHKIDDRKEPLNSIIKAVEKMVHVVAIAEEISKEDKMEDDKMLEKHE